jgi:hypothetical protein
VVRGRTALVWAALGGAVLVAAGVIALACEPTLDDTVSIVTSRSVLAIQANPPEAKEGTPVTYTALVADGHGPVASASIQWDYCNSRNPLTNLEPVNTPCVQAGSSQLALIGHGEQVKGPTAAIPDFACANFGPNPPQLQDSGTDGSAPRPVDPDITGGYYQPVSVFLPREGGAPEVTIYPMRVNCGFSGAAQSVTVILNTQYHLNVNPQVESVTVVQDDAGGPALVPDTTGKTNSVSAGQKLTFRVKWPDCPTTDRCGDGVCGANESAVTEAVDAGAGTPNPFCARDCVPSPSPSCSAFPIDAGAEKEAGTANCVPPLYAMDEFLMEVLSCPHDCEGLVGGCPPGCETPPGCPEECKAPQGCPGAERYVNVDLETQSAVYQREGINVAWFATAGTFENDNTGRQGTDDTTTSDNGWTAPSATGPVHIWVVLRDDRHGIGWAGYALDVTK